MLRAAVAIGIAGDVAVYPSEFQHLHLLTPAHHVMSQVFGHV